MPTPPFPIMRELHLPKPLGEALDTFADAVSPFGLLDDALLGGGTVLAARWRHRISTDLDFFAPRESFYGTVVEQEDELRSALRRVAFAVFVGAHHVQCVMRKGDVEVGIHDAMYGATTDDERSEDVVGACAIGTQTTATILRRKIIGRLMDRHEVTARDVYDICVSEKEDREAMLAATRDVPAGLLRQVANELTFYVEGGLRGKPLIRPTHPEIASNLAHCGRDVLLSMARHVEALRAKRRTMDLSQ